MALHFLQVDKPLPGGTAAKVTVMQDWEGIKLPLITFEVPAHDLQQALGDRAFYSENTVRVPIEIKQFK